MLDYFPPATLMIPSFIFLVTYTLFLSRMVLYCQARVQSQAQVPNLGPKSKDQIQAYVKKKKILPEENQEEKNEILDKTCRNNSS